MGTLWCEKAATAGGFWNEKSATAPEGVEKYCLLLFVRPTALALDFIGGLECSLNSKADRRVG